MGLVHVPLLSLSHSLTLWLTVAVHWCLSQHVRLGPIIHLLWSVHPTMGLLELTLRHFVITVLLIPLSLPDFSLFFFCRPPE